MTTQEGTDKLFRPRFRRPDARRAPPRRPPVGRRERADPRSHVDFSKHIQKADEARKRRNYDFAIELYRQLLDLDPDLGEARSGLRHALRGREERAPGGRFLRAVSGALPLSRAKAMFKLGKYDACARALEDYLGSKPLDEDANLMLGVALEQAGHFRSARAVYEFLAEIAPKNPEGLKRAGAILQRDGEFEQALDYYERALTADPRDRDALKARKNLAAETALSRRSDETVRHSRDLIQDKEAARELERAQRRHLSEDELREQLNGLEERFAETPDDPDLMLRLAEVHERLGDPAAALELAERALQYRRDSADVAARVGDLRAKALELELSRASEAGAAERAGALERELVEHRIADFRERVKARPADSTLRLGLARNLAQGGELDAAVAELQKCQADPRVRDDALLLLARCFEQKGLMDLARKNYERALEGADRLGERAKEILYHLGAIAESLGNADEARSYYIRIYEVDIGYRDVADKMKP